MEKAIIKTVTGESIDVTGGIEELTDVILSVRGTEEQTVTFESSGETRELPFSEISNLTVSTGEGTWGSLDRSKYILVTENSDVYYVDERSYNNLRYNRGAFIERGVNSGVMVELDMKTKLYIPSNQIKEIAYKPQ